MYRTLQEHCARSLDAFAGVVARHFRGVIAPVLFALLVFAAVRQHSWSPIQTLALVTGYFFCMAALIFWVCLLRGIRLSMPPELSKPLTLLAMSVTVSLLLSVNIELAFQHLILYVSVIAVAVAIYLLYRDAPRIPLAGFCAGIALVHMPFVLDVVLWLRDGEPPFFSRGIGVPHFSHVRQFAELGFVAAVCATALTILTQRWGLSSILLTSVALFGVIATGSRGALLSWMIFAALMMALSERRMRISTHALAALGLAAGAVWYLHSSGLLLTPNIFVRIAVLGEPGAGFDSGRLWMWGESLWEIARHPLFGQGPEAYMTSGCCLRSVRQPHNVILQLMMEFGIIGCAILGVVVWRTVKRLGGPVVLLRRVTSSDSSLVLAAATAAYLAYGMIDGVFYHPMPMLHLALFCGLLGAVIHQKTSLVRTVPG